MSDQLEPEDLPEQIAIRMAKRERLLATSDAYPCLCQSLTQSLKSEKSFQP